MIELTNGSRNTRAEAHTGGRRGAWTGRDGIVWGPWPAEYYALVMDNNHPLFAPTQTGSLLGWHNTISNKETIILIITLLSLQIQV
jgi:hypothetical protein